MVVGEDPGRVGMFTAVYEHGSKTACPSKEFCAMSGCSQYEKTVKGWHAKAPPCVQNLHKCVATVLSVGIDAPSKAPSSVS